MNFWANLHITAHFSRRELFRPCWVPQKPLSLIQPALQALRFTSFCWLSIPCLPAIIALKLSPTVWSAHGMKLRRTSIGNPTGIALDYWFCVVAWSWSNTQTIPKTHLRWNNWTKAPRAAGSKNRASKNPEKDHRKYLFWIKQVYK